MRAPAMESALVALLLAGCNGAASVHGPDAAIPSDFSMPIAIDAAVLDGATVIDFAQSAADGAPVADELACEAALVAGWRASTPSLGMASASSAAAYDPLIAKLMTDYSVPGGAVAVIHNQKLVFAKGYGFADRDAPALVHPDDLFRVASVTKQITSAEIMKLVEAGLLSLDDHPFDILSDLQPVNGAARNPKLAQITVRNLLQHTGGWNRDATFDPMFLSRAISSALGIAGPASCTDTIRYMLDKPLTYDPGTTTCYSNFGYCVLGRVIERKTSKTYADAVKSTLLDPLGAHRMAQGRTLPALRADGEVRYYDYPGAPLAASVFPSVTGPVPGPYGGFAIEAMDSHGAWIASPIDLLRFQIGVDGRGGNDLLSTASVTAMTADPMVPSCNDDGSTTPADPAYWYGFGWQLNQYGNWWHTGSLPGTSTEVVRAMNGYGWAVFLDTRPTGSDANAFGARLDGDPWQPINGAAATGFLADDLFDQWTLFNPWVSETIFNSTLATGSAAGQHPSRIEGRLNGAAFEYRAQLVPLHAGAAFHSAVGLGCREYQTQSAAWVAQGYQLVDLQWFQDANGVRRFQVVWGKL